jgi:hypothetical protein
MIVARTLASAARSLYSAIRALKWSLVQGSQGVFLGRENSRTIVDFASVFVEIT